MATLLHTADVHLTPANSDRLAALDAVLDRAREAAVDVVTIGGDLFDRPADVEHLRTELRNDRFSEQPFEILLIPGNHDVEAFRGDVFFGDSCTVMTDEPYDQWTTPDGSLRITGLPYREQPDDDLLLALQEREPFDGVESLLLHCSLDAPFEDYETGDEATHRYFPVSEELLVELDFEYYLAGHYHSPHQVSFDDGSEFSYPGTPASTSTSETGQRQVALLDSDTGLSFRTLETFHYLAREWTVTPGREGETLDEIRDWIATHVRDQSEASVTVDGFIDQDESTFHEELANAAAPASVTDETRSVEHILDHQLFRSFEDELAETAWDEETRAAVTERTLEVFSELSASGEI